MKKLCNRAIKHLEMATLIKFIPQPPLNKAENGLKHQKNAKILISKRKTVRKQEFNF